MKENIKISFSPPDITQLEIDAVAEVLRSGWITTGPKTKEFEKKITKYCESSNTACLNSATAALELTLRILGVGEGDEVITSAYTYTASASVIAHVGAKIVLVDTGKNSFHMDYDALSKAITKKTKAIIPVDIAGVMCDYDKIFEVANKKRNLFSAKNKFQENLGRICVIADGAHSFGAEYKGEKSGSVADFTCFSFHAVKNLTTGEGGAVTWKNFSGINNDDIYKEYMLLSLHGQSKDALEKTNKGGWEYDIVAPHYKCNMTDISAAIGIVQLERYETMLNKRRELINIYDAVFKDTGIVPIKHYTTEYKSSGHLYLTRLLGKTETQRNKLIKKLAEEGIATNVHYKPLPLHTGYKTMGFNINDFPNAYDMYENEITLPLHTLLDGGTVGRIGERVLEICGGMNG